MPINYKHSDIFSEDADAIVNTVNCVGVMGKGVALQFKNYSLENFKAYKKLCDAGEMVTGKVFVFDLGNNLLEKRKPRYLINFPTKKHWRQKSKLEYIEKGLDDFIKQIKKLGIKSVAMPALGCGNGGLQWDAVRQIIHDKLNGIQDIEFIVIPPREINVSPEHKGPTHRMTFERAILLKILGEFEDFFGGYLTHTSMQELVYFLQNMGINYNMKFELSSSGPFSNELANIFELMEKKAYIKGFDEGEVQVTSTAFSEANDHLNEDIRNSEQIIKNLSQLIDGFESPYGMELLAGTHFAAVNDGADFDIVMSRFNEWKGTDNQEYNECIVRQAYNRLEEDGLIIH